MRATQIPDELFLRLLRARERVLDAPDDALRVRELARHAGLSPFHFLRAYRAAFGETPGRHQTKVRLARARDLLARGVPVTEACFAVGFSSLGSFSTRFSRDYRMSPRAFQREVRAIVSVPARVAAVYVPACFVQHYM